MIGKGTLKAPIAYVLFKKEDFEELEQFVAPLIAQKTKKFNSKGRVSIQTPTGNVAFEDGDVLVRLNEDNWLAMSRENFDRLFQSVE